MDVAWNRCVGSTLSESCAEVMRVIPREQAENKEVKEWVHASYAVYGLDTSGDRTGIVSSAVREGRLEFTASVEGPRGSRMLYEIVRKN